MTATTVPSTSSIITAVGADSNIIRKRSSLSQEERERRERPVREQKRRDQRRQEPRVEAGERAERDAEPCDHELDREPGGGEEAALAEAVTATEAQHHREQRVVDRDEATAAARPESAKRVPPAADGLDREPGGERAQRSWRR